MKNILLIISSFFVVTQIHCKSQYGPCDSQDLQYAQKFVGQNIFMLPTAKVAEELEQSFKNQKVYVHKILPHTIDIAVEKRKAYFGVRKPGTPVEIFLVSKDGIILSFETDTALPVVVLEDSKNPGAVGQTVDDATKQAGIILDVLQKVQQVKTSKLDKAGLTVTITQVNTNIDVIFNPENDPQVQVGALQLILEKAKMDNKMPKVIDLRFKNPVLKF